MKVALSLLSRVAATDRSHGRQPVGRCRFEGSPVGAKDSREICRPFGAHRHIGRKTHGLTPVATICCRSAALIGCASARYLGQSSLGAEGKTRKNPSRLLQLCVTFLLVSSLTACSKTSPRADETRGQALYQLHCAPCHETPPPDLLKEPPKLKGLFKSKTLPSGEPATDEQVRMVIVGGLRTMPAFQGRLQEQDIRDLIAYLHKM
jgi:cytochrome c553